MPRSSPLRKERVASKKAREEIKKQEKQLEAEKRKAARAKRANYNKKQKQATSATQNNKKRQAARTVGSNGGKGHRKTAANTTGLFPGEGRRPNGDFVHTMDGIATAEASPIMNGSTIHSDLLEDSLEAGVKALLNIDELRGDAKKDLKKRVADQAEENKNVRTVAGVFFGGPFKIEPFKGNTKVGGGFVLGQAKDYEEEGCAKKGTDDVIKPKTRCKVTYTILHVQGDKQKEEEFDLEKQDDVDGTILYMFLEKEGHGLSDLHLPSLIKLFWSMVYYYVYLVEKEEDRPEDLKDVYKTIIGKHCKKGTWEEVGHFVNRNGKKSNAK